MFNNLRTLLEEPQSIEPTEFRFDEFESNHFRAKKLLHSSKKKIIKNYGKNINLFQIGNQIALINETDETILYYVKWIELKYKIIGKTAISEIMLWKNRKIIGPFEFGKISPYVFWELLFPIHKIMISDRMQTSNGRIFWVRRITEAFERNLNVYYLNLLPSKDTKNPELILVDSHEEFWKLESEKNFWGDEQFYQARKIIISEYDL